MTAAEVFWKYKWVVLVILIIATLAIVFYFYGRQSKPSSTVTVVDDNGNPVTPTTAETQQANALAVRLYASIGTWWNRLSGDPQIFTDLAATSNTVFTLTLSNYTNQFKQDALADMQTANSAIDYSDTSALQSLIERATTLGIT